jgi:hypothetical protein
LGFVGERGSRESGLRRLMNLALQAVHEKKFQELQKFSKSIDKYKILFLKVLEGSPEGDRAASSSSRRFPLAALLALR